MIKNKDLIYYAYRDAMALYEVGMTLKELEEVFLIHEKKELYLHCQGIKKAIDDIKNKQKNHEIYIFITFVFASILFSVRCLFPLIYGSL